MSCSSSGPCKACPAHGKSSFSALETETCGLVERVRQPKIVKAGQSLSSLGVQKEGYYCIRQGFMKLSILEHGRSKPVKIFGAGDLIPPHTFGQPANPTIYDGTALEDCSVCFFESESFFQILRQSHEIAHRVVEKLFRDLLNSDRIIFGLADHNVRNRVTTILLQLAERFGEPSQFGLKISVQIDRKLLATMAGTVIESTARVLTDLETEGLIVREKRKLHVVCLDRLRRSLR